MILHEGCVVHGPDRLAQGQVQGGACPDQGMVFTIAPGALFEDLGDDCRMLSRRVFDFTKIGHLAPESALLGDNLTHESDQIIKLLGIDAQIVYLSVSGGGRFRLVLFGRGDGRENRR